MEFILQNKNVTIPKKRTTYWCSFIKAPEINTKHHITKFEPYVQQGNEGLVQHLLVYECHGKFNESLYGPGFDCHNTANMPLEQCYSSSVVAAWAVGGEAFYYPPKVGYPIGTADSPSSYLLEMHYDNTDGVEGHNDSSGVRFYYTSNLREYDAGIFAIGEATTSFLVIPPRQESWLSVGYCSKECYKQNLNSTKLPEKGIKVFAALLHTHLQGRASWTKHVRNGVELPEIARDDNYDFNFQDIQVLRKEVHIKPGDDLIHYCKYDTMDREKLVQGGFSTSQEMCLDLLFYYPRMVNAPSFCNSVRRKPVLDFIDKHFPSISLNLASNWSNPLVGRNITWTNDMVEDLRRGYNQAKTFISVCLWRRSANYTLPIPEITKAQPRPKSNCPELPPPESNSFLAAASPTVVLSLLTSYLMFF